MNIMNGSLVFQGQPSDGKITLPGYSDNINTNRQHARKVKKHELKHSEVPLIPEIEPSCMPGKSLCRNTTGSDFAIPGIPLTLIVSLGGDIGDRTGDSMHHCGANSLV